jgi:HSP20 family protein
MAKQSIMPLDFSKNLESFKEISRDLERLERSFNDFWQRSPLALPIKEKAMMPSIDVIENDQAVQIVADLPGFNEEDIHVDINNRIFTLYGEKKEEKEESRNNYYIAERSTGCFRRTFQLPAAIDENRIEAILKDGVLKVILPKSPESERQRKKIKISKE